MSVTRTWRDVLGFDALFPGELSAAEANALVSVRHRSRIAAEPAGSAAETELNAARDAALKDIGA